MYTETNVEIQINGHPARITRILYNLGLYECYDNKNRQFFIDENATIELNGIKVRAFDQPVLDFCEAVAALNKI